MHGCCWQQLPDFLTGLWNEPIKIISSYDDLIEILSNNVRQYHNEFQQQQNQLHHILVRNRR